MYSQLIHVQSTHTCTVNSYMYSQLIHVQSTPSYLHTSVLPQHIPDMQESRLEKVINHASALYNENAPSAGTERIDRIGKCHSGL